jgi:hypothetical protein
MVTAVSPLLFKQELETGPYNGEMTLSVQLPENLIEILLKHGLLQSNKERDAWMRFVNACSQLSDGEEGIGHLLTPSGQTEPIDYGEGSEWELAQASVGVGLLTLQALERIPQGEIPEIVLTTLLRGVERASGTQLDEEPGFTLLRQVLIALSQ